MNTPQPTTVSSSQGEPAQPYSPPVIDDFELLQEIARGGMGVVYKARQVSLDRIVALKMILAGPNASPDLLRRFRTEAETVARLAHPNLIAIYQIGDYYGMPYLVMEYIEGGSLDAVLTGRPQPPREAAAFVETLARALHVVHQRGIIHRDLKPANVLLAATCVSEDPAKPQAARKALADCVPKITDFGLAKRIDNPGPTIAGDVIGTPGYLAPEQAAGRSSEVGPQADLFSLGAILYEILTGQQPFSGRTTVELITQVLREAPVAPRRLVRTIPRDLETICLKCLRKSPAQRYQDARELADDLARFQAGQPIIARPTPTWERLWLWARRHPSIASVTAVGLLGLIVLFVGGAIYQARLRAALQEVRDVAELSRQRLVQLCVSQGNRALDTSDHFAALHWFVEALRLDEGHSDARRLYRLCLATIQRASPDLRQLWLHQGPGRVAELHKDGTRVLLGGSGGLATVLDVTTGKPVHPPFRHTTSVVAGLFAGQDGHVFVGCHDGSVWFHSADSGRSWSLPGSGKDGAAHSGAITRLKWAEKARLLLTASQDGSARLWSGGAAAPARWTFLHKAPVNAIDLTTDGGLIVTAADNVVHLWDGKTGMMIGAPLAHPSRVLDVCLAPDGTTLATACADGGVRLYDQAGKLLVGPLLHRAAVVSVDFHPDGSQIITASEDNTARVWNVRSGAPICPPLRHTSDVNGAWFSADGKQVVTASDDNTARVWDPVTGDPIGPILRHNGTVQRAGFGPLARLLLTSSNDGTARLWDLRPERGSVPPVPFSAPARAAPGQPGRWVSPDGRLVLTAVGDHGAQLSDVTSSERIGPVLWHGAAVEHAAFSPQGDRVATASDDNMTRVWDTRTGDLVGRPQLHRGTVRQIAFGPEGRLLFTSGADYTARVSDVERGQPVTPMWPVRSPVRAAIFSEDGLRVSAYLENGKVHTWDLTPDERPLEELQRLAVVLSGRSIDPRSGMLPVEPERLLRLWEQGR